MSLSLSTIANLDGFLIVTVSSLCLFCFLRKQTSSQNSAMDDLEKSVLMGGFIGASFGILQASFNFATPDLIGPGISLGLISLFYGFALNLFFVFPAKYFISKKRGETGSHLLLPNVILYGAYAVAIFAVKSAMHLLKQPEKLAQLLGTAAAFLIIGHVLFAAIEKQKNPLKTHGFGGLAVIALAVCIAEVYCAVQLYG